MLAEVGNIYGPSSNSRRAEKRSAFRRMVFSSMRQKVLFGG